jgi:hypothetical protein
MWQASAALTSRAPTRWVFWAFGATALFLLCFSNPVRGESEARAAPHVIVIVDESGSMEGKHGWIEDVLSELRVAVARDVESAADARLRLTFAGFTRHSRMIAVEATLDADSARRSVRKLIARGGTEDGLAALVEVLSDLPMVAGDPTLILLITDEDRDVVDPSLSFEVLSEYLVETGTLLHLATRSHLTCRHHQSAAPDSEFIEQPEVEQAVAVDRNDMAFILREDGFAECPNARSAVYENYAELAWGTKGLVWDLGYLVLSDERGQRTRELLGSLLAGWIRIQPNLQATVTQEEPD